MVDSLAALDRYPWSGHGSVMGKVDCDWHDTAYVLNWFGKSLKQARRVYRIFVEKGIAMGQQPQRHWAYHLLKLQSFLAFQPREFQK